VVGRPCNQKRSRVQAQLFAARCATDAELRQRGLDSRRDTARTIDSSFGATVRSLYEQLAIAARCRREAPRPQQRAQLVERGVWLVMAPQPATEAVRCRVRRPDRLLVGHSARPVRCTSG